ncbi:MAG: glucose-phosphate thymidylyltransferase, partial [Thermoleophilaceae bacterium]|nr:glucose-phosphate thymidylyltransferase [Thermoleophilaceae bacterium]
MGNFRGLVRVAARAEDELCLIAGPGCPYTLPMAGRPLLTHAVKSLCDAGVTQILVAIDGSIAEVVAPHVGELRGAEVHIAIQPDGDDDATARAVDKAFGPGPLAVTFGDTLVAATAGEVLADATEQVVELETAWRYHGTVDGILEANTIALDALKRARVGVDITSANIQGRAQIDPSAELDGAKIRGPVYIGPGARLVETYVGPYTSIGAGVTL